MQLVTSYILRYRFLPLMLGFLQRLPEVSTGSKSGAGELRVIPSTWASAPLSWGLGTCIHLTSLRRPGCSFSPTEQMTGRWVSVSWLPMVPPPPPQHQHWPHRAGQSQTHQEEAEQITRAAGEMKSSLKTQATIHYVK